MKQVLLFSVDSFERFELGLDKMSDNELYSLCVNDGETSMRLSLAQFQQMCNDEYISLDNWWVYFVDVNEE